MFLAIFLFFAHTAALPLTVERTDNGSVIVSQSVVVSEEGKRTNISSTIIIRNKKKTSTSSAEDASTVLVAWGHQNIPKKLTTCTKRGPPKPTRQTSARALNSFLTKLATTTRSTYMRQKAEIFETTEESFLDIFNWTSITGSGSSKTRNRNTSVATKASNTKQQGIVAGIARLFQKKSTSKPPRVFTAPSLAAEMLRDSFQIDYGWVHRKRLRRNVLSYPTTESGENVTAKPDVNRVGKDAKMVLLLLIALVILALSAVISHRPGVDSRYCIRLQPGGPVLYQPVSSSDCQEADNTYQYSFGPRDERFVSLVRTKLLASRMVRRHKDRSGQGFVPQPSQGHLVDVATSPGLQSPQPASTALSAEHYTANVVLSDVPEGVRKFVVKVQLHQQSESGSVNTYHKELTFDLDS